LAPAFKPNPTPDGVPATHQKSKLTALEFSGAGEHEVSPRAGAGRAHAAHRPLKGFCQQVADRRRLHGNTSYLSVIQHIIYLYLYLRSQVRKQRAARASIQAAGDGWPALGGAPSAAEEACRGWDASGG